MDHMNIVGVRLILCVCNLLPPTPNIPFAQAEHHPHQPRKIQQAVSIRISDSNFTEQSSKKASFRVILPKVLM
jgi:hypothetical protein